MKISDLYVTLGNTNVGIFYSISGRLYSTTSTMNSNTYKYLNKVIGGSTNTLNLDTDYHLNYSSNKNVSILVDNILKGEEPTKEYNDKLASIIISRFFDKWEHIITTMELEYNAIENYSMVEEESSNNSGETSSSGSSSNETKQKSNLTTTNNVEHKRSGYNSSTYEPDSQDTQTTLVKGSPDENYTNATNSTTDSLSTSNEGSRTLTRSGNIGVTTSQQMIESELKLREYNINKMMYDDIDTILTSSLYI